MMTGNEYFWLGFAAGTLFGGSAGVAAVLFVIYWRVRNKGDSSNHAEEEDIVGEAFCGNCGINLPKGSSFCNDKCYHEWLIKEGYLKPDPSGELEEDSTAKEKADE